MERNFVQVVAASLELVTMAALKNSIGLPIQFKVGSRMGCPVKLKVAKRLTRVGQNYLGRQGERWFQLHNGFECDWAYTGLVLMVPHPSRLPKGLRLTLGLFSSKAIGSAQNFCAIFGDRGYCGLAKVCQEAAVP
jgi:hypothetical protein